MCCAFCDFIPGNLRIFFIMRRYTVLHGSFYLHKTGAWRTHAREWLRVICLRGREGAHDFAIAIYMDDMSTPMCMRCHGYIPTAVARPTPNSLPGTCACTSDVRRRSHARHARVARTRARGAPGATQQGCGGRASPRPSALPALRATHSRCHGRSAKCLGLTSVALWLGDECA